MSKTRAATFFMFVDMIVATRRRGSLETRVTGTASMSKCNTLNMWAQSGVEPPTLNVAAVWTTYSSDMWLSGVDASTEDVLHELVSFFIPESTSSSVGSGRGESEGDGSDEEVDAVPVLLLMLLLGVLDVGVLLLLLLLFITSLSLCCFYCFPDAR